MDYRHNPKHDDQDLYQALFALPKIDLHRHLEGSLRLGTMADIAQEYGLELPGTTPDEFRHLVQMMPSDESSADVFISKFDTLRHFYRSPEIIQRVAYEVVADAAAENIAYLELRFTPIALVRQNGYALEDAVDWVIDAVDRAKDEFNIDVRLIVSMNRHESVDIGKQHLDAAIANMDRGVVAVDLAGLENRFPSAPFLPLFEHAREAGLNITIHAGEWAGPESVVEAVTQLGAQRIGHGVRITEDPLTMKLILDRNIPLEVCPTSNVQSGVANALSTHPITNLYEAGVIVTLNTDDPSIEGINLTDEYVNAVQHMGLNLDDLKQLTMNAASSAFLPAAELDALVKQMQTVLSTTEETTAPSPNNS